ncbi:hypothetical protein [Sodalis sp. dw_96]|uniref:hypothetical protein n=1 Tax=Sodalis sp. dw_96 TaxID=2719794 RepID=UPI001BD419FE|nr:hypothetical protein [Sodalis sp. dw_96]
MINDYEIALFNARVLRLQMFMEGARAANQYQAQYGSVFYQEDHFMGLICELEELTSAFEAKQVSAS